ncbi:SMODS domain-containing nucleotidyltransferase [Idiomarina sp. ST10R2A5]|uniref:SMODS domain-containing nucleotidyltransferase n=1 Tax=Idiomarina sp. ST10R2A5 TaxID=3418368 RepID=UPI003EC80D2A
MPISDMFSDFLDNIKVDSADTISLRYGEISSALNKCFRDTDSKTANSLRVGSYGRWTAIKSVSDLDMMYIMPKSKWDHYKDGKQSKLLSDARDAIKARYRTTKVKVDQLIVKVSYADFDVEVQPVFENDDGSYTFPYTYDGGSWKKTKPCEEMAAMTEFDKQKNRNLRRLCKMTRAWKNRHGVVMGGLLVDTLAYNFLKSTSNYDNKSFTSYDELCRDFFAYLKDQPDQDHYKALGSNQNVNVKKKFQPKAKKAYNLCVKAIQAGTENKAYGRWKKVFGRDFPTAPEITTEALVGKAAKTWRNTEQFVEDLYSLHIDYQLEIDCDVYRADNTRNSLRQLLARGYGISSNKKLIFKIKSCDVAEPYEVRWKVLNRGAEARSRDCIRGEIMDSNLSNNRRKEKSDFKGNHLVECYVLLGNRVVARDEIEVPIL